MKYKKKKKTDKRKPNERKSEHGFGFTRYLPRSWSWLRDPIVRAHSVALDTTIGNIIVHDNIVRLCGKVQTAGTGTSRKAGWKCHIPPESHQSSRSSTLPMTFFCFSLYRNFRTTAFKFLHHLLVVVVLLLILLAYLLLPDSHFFCHSYILPPVFV